MNEDLFETRVSRAPRVFEAEHADDTMRQLAQLPGATAEVVRGVAGCSPYLRGLLLSEAEWSDTALRQSPETAFAAVLDAAMAAPHDQRGTALRLAKRRVALLTGLCDAGGVWSLEKVTEALSRFADLAVWLALEPEITNLIARDKIPGAGEGDLNSAAGMVVLAMGKMGANELNYSSDIDLICLFDDARYPDADYLDARSAFVRATRRMAATLSDITAEGYVFRTDLRLRPDPSVTPVCLSMDAAERYYESLGRTWERAAYIKARPCVGDLAAGRRFLDHLAPFVWRKHLDFAAIEEAHDMRLRIRAHKGLHSDALEGRNLKLAPGGIREIEFFTQTRQIIAGGRDPDLRSRRTVDALRALAGKGWVTPDDAETLIEDYRAHREVEHRIQMIADQQTHDLPSTEEGFERLAAFMGTDRETFRATLSERIARVSRLTEGFFAPGVSSAPTPELSDTAREIVSRWPSYPALRSDRALRIFKRLRPELLGRLSRVSKPDEALVHLDGFLAGLPAGVQLFSLFEANPSLIDLIVDIASTAPALAAHLSQNAQVFDAVIGGDFFAEWPGREALAQDLGARLSSLEDYEHRLDAARRWQKEWHFRVGVHHLRGLIDGDVAAQEYADLAGAVLSGVWDAVIEEFSARHGPPPGIGAVLLGMGSLGSERLTATSDLDLIVIYDADGVEMSDGRRPLASRTYYARLTQAMITALSAPMAEGRLYEADMRLRPSGRQGPVATSIAAFEAYQRDEAWTWEHLALTRARPVAGSEALAARLEAFRVGLLPEVGARDGVLRDVRDMRARLADAVGQIGGLEAKRGAGRLQDVALLAQAGALLAGAPARDVPNQLAAGQSHLGLSEAELLTLTEADHVMWRVQAAARLMTSETLEPEAAGAGGRAFLLRECGAEDIEGLIRRLDALATAAAEIIGRSLGDDGT